MGLEDKKKKCTSVFRLSGSRGAVCVGYVLKSLLGVPASDVIHMCMQTKENLEQTTKFGACIVKEIHCMTPEEAMKLGASLIQAAGFYKASVDQ